MSAGLSADIAAVDGPSLQQTLLGVHRRSWQLAGMADHAAFPYAAKHPPSPEPEPEPEPEPQPQPEPEPAVRTDLLGQEFRILEQLQKLETDELEPLRGTLAAMARSLDVLDDQRDESSAARSDDKPPSTPDGADLTVATDAIVDSAGEDDEESRRLQVQVEAAAERVSAAMRKAEHASGMAEQARRVAAAAEERAEQRRQDYMKLAEPEPECTSHPADDLMISIDILGSEDGESEPSEATPGDGEARPAAPTPRRASGGHGGAAAGLPDSASAAAEKAAWDSSHGWHESDASAQDSYGSAHYGKELQDEDDASTDGSDEEDDEHSHNADVAIGGAVAASAAQEAMYQHAFHHLQSVQQLRHQREQLRARATRELGAQNESPPDERSSKVMGNLRARVSVGPGGALALDLSGNATHRLV
eukprot:COSAG02_NODE_6881_length_3310_cov_4.296792_1_plen_419_part_00